MFIELKTKAFKENQQIESMDVIRESKEPFK
jgi:hypothetical protein